MYVRRPWWFLLEEYFEVIMQRFFNIILVLYQGGRCNFLTDMFDNKGYNISMHISCECPEDHGLMTVMVSFSVT
jgi:hypothetical protein